MAGVKGRSGPKQEKPWRDALLRAVKRRDGDVHLLDRIADAVVAAASFGDMQAAKEIGDRLDGKAPQSLEMSGSVGTYEATEIPVEPREPDPLAIPARPSEGSDPESLH